MNTTETSTKTKNTNPPESMTIREAIQAIQEHVKDKLSNDDADTIRIMEHVAELNETGILTSLDKKLKQKQIQKLFSIINRLEKDEPLDYITGSSDFHGRRFYVSKDTLIPRPETEMLVDLAIGYAHEKLFAGKFKTKASPKNKPLKIADIGTGTGCVIISTALMIREMVSLYASDISPEAVTIAQKNLHAYHLTQRVEIQCGNLLEPFADNEKFDIILGNLPYIRSVDIPTLPNSVKKYEPKTALNGGKNGTQLIKQLLMQATERLNAEGIIILEIQPKIIQTLKKFARRTYPDAQIAIIADQFGMDRFMTIRTG